MNPEQSRKTKRPRDGERPFPWRCRQCGKQEVTLAKTGYDAELRHDGRLHAFTIVDLELPVCHACGDRVFTEKVDAQINDALRSHLNLLTPAQIRDAIKRLEMSQKDIAGRLGIAEATLSRWLNETQIQSRAMDNLLRVFFGFPDVRMALCDNSQVPQLGLSDVVETGSPHDRKKSRHSHFRTESSWLDDWNGKRSACRQAHGIIEGARSTWGRRRVG